MPERPTGPTLTKPFINLFFWNKLRNQLPRNLLGNGVLKRDDAVIPSGPF